jgi:hypothetical protein
MIASLARSPRVRGAWLAACLIVAACGATPNATPSPSSSPTATPSVAPSASASAQPSASGATDAATGITIGAPYVLKGNPANPALSGTFRVQLAGQTIEAVMNGREIRKDATLVGLVLVMKFSGTPVTREVLDGAAKGAATSSAGKVAFSTILGNRVAFVTSSNATFGLYARGDSILMVGGPTGTDAKALLTSVIKENS